MLLEKQTTPREWEGREQLKGAYHIALHRIQPDPTQPRRAFEPAELAGLVESIKQLGILQPISVRYRQDLEVYQVISGERRFQAAKLAGLEQMPCWVQTPEDRQILVRQVVENWQRADLHPFEIADALGELRDRWDYSQNEIAELIGKSKGEVSKFLLLLTLPDSIKQECRDDPSGALTRKHLETIARAPKATQERLFEHVKAAHLTLQDTDKLVKDTVARTTGQKRQGAPAGTVFRYGTLKAKVTVQFRKSQVKTAEVLEALDAARRQAARPGEGKSTEADAN